jgi:hypothetical protein
MEIRMRIAEMSELGKPPIAWARYELKLCIKQGFGAKTLCKGI